MITVRAITTQDHEERRSMYLDYASVWNENIQEDRLQKLWGMLTAETVQAYGLIALDDEQILGFANYITYPCTYSTGLTCYLQDLYVKPQSRNQGIGRALLGFLFIKGEKEDWRSVHWRTRPDNEAGIVFYNKIAKKSDWIYFEKNFKKR